jgi:hypothetical protein
MKMQQNESQRIAEKFITKINDEAERKRREKALDEAIENTFPASDPVSAEQPVLVARALPEDLSPVRCNHCSQSFGNFRVVRLVAMARESPICAIASVRLQRSTSSCISAWGWVACVIHLSRLDRD